MDELYVHSRCCNAHWELVWKKRNFSLECEECGKPAGDFIITGPDLTGCECEECKKREKSE